MITTYAGATALVTGASMGLGAETARQLAVRGVARLVLTARSADRLEALAAALRERHGTQVDVLPLDLTAAGAPEQLLEQTTARGLTVDVLVNNAGFGKWGPFESRPLEVARAMIALNCEALVSLTHLFGVPMLERSHGAILQVGSLAGFFTLPYLSLYAATKAFVTAFSEGLWAEWRARGVTVTCLCPGPTESEFHQTSGTHLRDRKLMRADVVVRKGLDGLLAGRPTVFASTAHMLMSRTPALCTRRAAAALLARKTRGRT